MSWPKGRPRAPETLQKMSKAMQGKARSTQARLRISKGHTGRVPIVSPYLPGDVIVRFTNGHWSCERSDASGRRRNVRHAHAVWEHYRGMVPKGMHVHHKNGDSSNIEFDRVDNLMLLTMEWNLRFMPVLSKGFGIPEAWVTDAYVVVESLPYEQRFVAVVKILLEKTQ